MRKLFILLQVVVIILTLTACTGPHPFSYPLTKWQGSGFELYIGEYEYYNDTLDKVSKNTYGIMLYKTSDGEVMVFDAEELYGGSIYIYKHRDSAEQELELVASYHTAAFSSEERCEIHGRDLKEQAYAKIFPESIVFRKQCDITPEDIKYDFIQIGIEEGYKARGEEEYTNRLNSDGELEPESEADSPTIIVKEKREDGTISWWEKTSSDTANHQSKTGDGSVS